MRLLPGTKRTSRLVDLRDTSRLEAVRELCRESTLLHQPVNPAECLQMVKGVELNGRPYRQGTACQRVWFVKFVTPESFV